MHIDTLWCLFIYRLHSTKQLFLPIVVVVNCWLASFEF